MYGVFGNKTAIFKKLSIAIIVITIVRQNLKKLVKEVNNDDGIDTNYWTDY